MAAGRAFRSRAAAESRPPPIASLLEVVEGAEPSTNIPLASFFKGSLTSADFMNKSSSTLGVIIGNRDFFPDQLVAEARQDILKVLGSRGVKPVMVSPEETKLGGVETHADARKCADLFKRHRDELDGVLVVLPNFGDEKGVADTLKMSKLDMPVLIQAYPDDLGQLDVARRRDAFCGKISVCNNLVQAGIRFSLTTKHVSRPDSKHAWS